MMRRLPVISSFAGLGDIICAMRVRSSSRVIGEFTKALSAMTLAKNIYPVDSGASALYLILKALARISPKREVVLSAYTAGSLIVAIRKAGLKPVLSDISLEDFNMDCDAARKVISDKTLAVLAIHMFGIGLKGLKALRGDLPQGVFLIEDCCQAMGASSEGRIVGSGGDVSFFSFNRGKNLPLCGGGFISTEDVFIAKALDDLMRDLPDIPVWREFLNPIKAYAFSVGTNPYVYAVMRAFASRFKEAAPPEDIMARKMSNFHAALGAGLIGKMNVLARKRHDNGMYLLNKLSDLDGVILPKITDGEMPAFNRMPIVFKDLGRRRLAEDMLSARGVEPSRMYMRPLHHMFDLEYDRSEFPSACYLAERLLTLPAYPGLKRRDLDRMARAVTGALK